MQEKENITLEEALNNLKEEYRNMGNFVSELITHLDNTNKRIEEIGKYGLYNSISLLAVLIAFMTFLWGIK